MPFTLFHLGVSILIQSLFLFLDPLGLFMGTVLADGEGFLSIILPDSGIPLHGHWHSLIGAIVSKQKSLSEVPVLCSISIVLVFPCSAS